MIEIKKIKPLSVAKVMAVLFLIYSFIAAIISTIFDGFGVGNLFWSFIGIPALSTISGFLSGLISAFLYNLVVKMTGGIKLEESKGESKKRVIQRKKIEKIK